jgi:hypothetical protein
METNITGLTVFCTSEGTFGIYAHRADESAITTYQNLHETNREAYMWRYFPIRQGETIAKAWTYKAQSLIITSGPLLVVIWP